MSRRFNLTQGRTILNDLSRVHAIFDRCLRSAAVTQGGRDQFDGRPWQTTRHGSLRVMTA